MKKLVFLATLLFSGMAVADINDRQHPPPSSQAKVNRVIAQAYATRNPPVDHTAVYKNAVMPSMPNVNQGVSVGLSVGTAVAGKNGQVPREQVTVTRDNTVVCLNCRGK